MSLITLASRKRSFSTVGLHLYAVETSPCIWEIRSCCAATHLASASGVLLPKKPSRVTRMAVCSNLSCSIAF